MHAVTSLSLVAQCRGFWVISAQSRRRNHTPQLSLRLADGRLHVLSTAGRVRGRGRACSNVNADVTADSHCSCESLIGKEYRAVHPNDTMVTADIRLGVWMPVCQGVMGMRR